MLHLIKHKTLGEDLTEIKKKIPAAKKQNVLLKQKGKEVVKSSVTIDLEREHLGDIKSLDKLMDDHGLQSIMVLGPTEDTPHPTIILNDDNNWGA